MLIPWFAYGLVLGNFPISVGNDTLMGLHLLMVLGILFHSGLTLRTPFDGLA